MFPKTVFFGVLIVFCILYLSCKENTPTDTIDNENLLITLENHNQLENQALQLFDSLLVINQDTQTTISSVVLFFNNNPDVTWVTYNNYNAIVVEYSEGMLGGLLLEAGSENQLVKRNEIQNDLNTIPTKEGSLYLAYAPEYREIFFQTYLKMSEELSKVGYSFSSCELLENNQVTPISLRNISGKGVIHFNGHGVTIPNPYDSSKIDEVYLCLSYNINEDIEQINSNIYSDLRDKSIGTIKDLSGIRYYMVSPRYLAKYNDWHQENPIVWGGFCYSFLGTWQQSLKNIGTACYFGWDRAVHVDVDAENARRFYEFICETPVTDPFATTVGAYWLDYLLNYQPVDNNTAHLYLSGDPSTSLQETIPSRWMVGTYQPSFETAIAGYLTSTDELNVTFYTGNQQTPVAGFRINNASSLNVGSFVIPDFIFCIIDYSSADFSNMNWQGFPNPQSCYISFSQLNLRSFEKISGIILGYVYNVYPDQPDQTICSPIPIMASFENITIYSDVLKHYSKYNQVAFEYFETKFK